MRAALRVAFAAVASLAIPTLLVFIVMVLAVGVPEFPLDRTAGLWGVLMGLFAASAGMVMLLVIEYLHPSKEVQD